MHFDLKLWRMMAGLRGRIALSAGLGLLALAVGIARFAFLGRFLAGVFRGEAPVLPLAGAVGAVLLRAWLDHHRAMIAYRTATRVQETLRGRLFDKIVALGPAWFGAERTGGVMLSMVDGVEQLQSFFGQYLPQVTIAVCAPFAIFAFIAWWDVPVALVMLGAALFTLVLPATVHRRTGQASRVRQSAFKSFGEEFLDAVQGLPTLKAFGQSAAYGRMLAAKARALSDSTFWVLALNVLTRGLTDLGGGIGSAAALALGAWRVAHGEMSIEALLIVLMAGTEIFRPLRDLRGVLHQGMNGQAPRRAGSTPCWTPQRRSVRFGHAGADAGDRLRVRCLRLSGRAAGGACRAVVPYRRGGAGRDRGPERIGEVDDRPAAVAAARGAGRRHPHRRTRSAGTGSGAGPRDDRGGGAGHLPVPRHGRGEPAAGATGCVEEAEDGGRRPLPPTRTGSSAPCPPATGR